MIEKLRLDLQILLPGVDNDADACMQRLIDDLDGRQGIESVHVRARTLAEPAQLCIHYDPEVLPLSRIREIVQAAGAAISARFGHLRLEVDGITHERRARTLSELLKSQPGVLAAEASASGVVYLEFDRNETSGEQLQKDLERMGVSRRGSTPAPASAQGAAGGHGAADGHRHGPGHGAGHDHDHDHDHDGSGHAHDHAQGRVLGMDRELAFALACGLCLLAGYLIGKLLPAAPDGIVLACYLAAYFFGGVFTLREAIDNLRMKRFEIDTLMLVAAAGAAALGAWAEGALLLFLFSLGHALEHYAMGRAKRAIEALAELAPETATVRHQDGVRSVPVAELAPGDVIIVRPNERLPADGFLVAGTSSVDQAPVTGESIPVDKRPVEDAALARSRPESLEPSSRVYAGTINGSGAIEVEVTRRADDSTLARVVRMVSEAETRKSPTQRFTDRFERIFVPAVLGLTVVLLFASAVVDETFSQSFYRAMAVLVAASPCALAIATPSAVLSGIARAARSGVLIKGGAPLEELGALKAMAFDKTGTLTEGRPRITDLVPMDGVSEAQLLTVAVAVESLSDHPLAAAIVRDGLVRLEGQALAEASALQSLDGRGVSAMVDGHPVWIGKAEMFAMEGIEPLGAAAAAVVEQLRQAGRTTMVVRQGGRDLGVIGMLDAPRAGARAALQQLRALGIERMIMISGDHQRVAAAVAAEVGLDEAWGDLLPEDKVTAIRALRGQGKVAMVGDGVNDAPAMANATVGIAMGAAGSDVALEAADVALLADDLQQLPFAVGLSRHSRAIIRQNVFVSLGIVVLLVPATILGLGIGPAVAIHEGSTLLVVINALRLLAYRFRGQATAAKKA